MSDSIETIQMRPCAKRKAPLLLYSFPLLLLLFLFSPSANGQSGCPANNTIELKPPLCKGTMALLKGSTPTGGSGSYTYSWEMNKGNCSENGFVPIPGASGPDYAVPETADDDICYRRVVKAGNCRVESNKLKANEQKPVNPTVTVTQPTCTVSTGIITVTSPAPGNGITYSIDGTNYSNTTGVFSGLAPKTYSVSVKYTEGCISPSVNAKVNVGGQLPVGTISPAAATICAGGSQTLTATGGKSYQWSLNGVAINGADDATYKATQPGTYSVVITNDGCSAPASNTASVTVRPALTFTTTATDITCTAPAGTITVTNISGGSGSGYQYSKDNGTTFQPSNTFTGLAAGDYKIVVKDNADCKSTPKTFTIKEIGTTLKATAAPEDIPCGEASGSVSVSPSGGVPDYEYSLNGGSYQKSPLFTNLPAGSHKITVRDGAGCRVEVPFSIKQKNSTLSAQSAATDIPCGQNTGTAVITASGGTPPYSYSINGGAYGAANAFTSLAAGSHKASVKDAAGCTYELSFAIKQLASSLNATASATDVTCTQSTASATVTASGGVAPYSYSLNSGAFTSSATFSNLAAGTHKVNVKDALGCLFEVSFTVKQVGSVPALSITHPAKICNGATANLTAASVTAGSEAGLTYTYWRDSSATTVLNNPAAAGPGTYYIRGANPSGCFAIKPVTVTMHPTPSGIITATAAPPPCSNEPVTLTTSNGVSYQWYRNDTLISGATESTYKATVGGRYSVDISNGFCIAKASNTIMVQFTACLPVTGTDVYVPKAFTPDNNGANDLLRPVSFNIQTLHYFKVYNRWGQLVFQTAEIGKGWDGTLKGIPQPPETYTWILECTNRSGKLIKLGGRSLLIR